MLVIDEADEMLGRGFKEQMYDIYRYLPPQCQVTCSTRRLVLLFFHNFFVSRLF